MRLLFFWQPSSPSHIICNDHKKTEHKGKQVNIHLLWPWFVAVFNTRINIILITYYYDPCTLKINWIYMLAKEIINFCGDFHRLKFMPSINKHFYIFKSLWCIKLVKLKKGWKLVRLSAKPCFPCQVSQSKLIRVSCEKGRKSFQEEPQINNYYFYALFSLKKSHYFGQI